MTNLRSRLFWVVSWLVLVGVIVACFTYANSASGGSPPWVTQLIVSWFPFFMLISVLVWYLGNRLRRSSGTNWVDLYEQQVAESKRTNALLERIATALEKPAAG